MSSEKCVDQSEWNRLMKKFGQCAAKFHTHCSQCEYHSKEQEPGDVVVCSDSEEYYRIEALNDRWCEAYATHMAACELHQKHLGQLEPDVRDIPVVPEPEDSGYIH